MHAADAGRRETRLELAAAAPPKPLGVETEPKLEGVQPAQFHASLPYLTDRFMADTARPFSPP